MYIEWIVAAALIAASIITVIAIRKRTAHRQAPIKAWLASYQGVQQYYSDDENVVRALPKLEALGSIPPGFDHWQDVESARETIGRLRRHVIWQRHWANKSLADQYARAHKLSGFMARTVLMDPSDRYEAFDTYLKTSFRQYNHFYSEEFWPFARPIVQKYVAYLLEEARTGSRSDFLTLVSIVVRAANNYNLYKHMTGMVYQAPRDWDDLVIRYIKSPVLSDFAHVRTEQQPGEVRLLASRAVLNGSLKDAKIALAFCNNSGWRKEVGDVLTAELGKLVVSKHQMMNLTF